MMNIFFILLSSFFCFQAKELKNIIHSSWWAHYQSALKNTQQASDWFADIITADGSVCTYKGYIQYLYKHGQYQKLIEYCQSKKDLLEHDAHIKKLYALALLYTGDISFSDKILLQLARTDTHDLEVCFYAAQAYVRLKDYQNALLIVDTYLARENKEAGIFILYFLKSQICLQLNRIHDAKKACEQAVLLRPDFEKGWLLLAMLAEQEGDFNGAISGYKQYLALDTQSAIDTGVYNGILSAIARNFFLKQVNEKKHFNGSIAMQKAHSSFNNQHYLEAVEYANQFLCDDPSHLDMLCLKIEALVELERFHDVIVCILDQIEQSPTDKSWYKLLDWCIKYGLVDHELIMDRLKKIQEAHSKTVLPGLYMIDYYCNNQMFEKAEERFQFLNQQIKDSFLKEILLFRCADMYKQQKKYEKMIEQLAKILEIRSDNEIAFEILTDHFIHEKKYEKALEMVSQWRVLHAICPRALTKHGFILYKQGRYDEAQTLFIQVQVCQGSPLVLLYQAKIARKKGLYENAYTLCERAKNNATQDELHKINSLLAKLIAESPRQSLN